MKNIKILYLIFFFYVLVVRFSVYLKRHVFDMRLLKVEERLHALFLHQPVADPENMSVMCLREIRKISKSLRKHAYSNILKI